MTDSLTFVLSFDFPRQETALHAKEGLSSSLAQPSKALPGLKERISIMAFLLKKNTSFIVNS